MTSRCVGAFFRRWRHLAPVALMGAAVAAGCGQKIMPLRLSEPVPQVIQRHQAEMANWRAKPYPVELVVQADVAERVPAVDSGMLGTVERQVVPLGRTQYTYPIREALEAAFGEVMRCTFEEPVFGSDRPFRVRLTVAKSVLQYHKVNYDADAASADLTVDARLIDHRGRTVMSKTVVGQGQSAFDGVTTPQAVWQAAYDAAVAFSRSVRQEPLVARRADDWLSDMDLKSIVCVMKLVDTAEGRLVAAARGSADSESQLERETGVLASALAARAALGKSSKVGVIYFDVRGGSADIRLGESLADTMAAELVNLRRFEVHDRTAVAKLVEEDDFRKVYADPGRVLKFRGVDYLLIGSVNFYKKGRSN